MKSKHGALFALSMCLAGLTVAASLDEMLRVKPSPRTPTRRVRSVRPAAPSTSALQALNSCDEVRTYLIDVAVERVLEYRYNYRWFMVPWAGGAEDGREVADVPTDFTTTNTQEQGVDELDIVKTNGTHLYAAEGDRLHVLRSWPADSTSELATVEAPDYSSGLFLRGNRVLVVSYGWSGGAEEQRGRGAEERRSRGAEEQRGGYWLLVTGY
ncbi:beta-propeller domain-containing protein [Acidobacteriota bacterium]